MSDLLRKAGAQVLKVVDSIADIAFREPVQPHKRGATKAGDVIGPKALANAVTGSVFPTLAMIVLALFFLIILWVFAKIGIWPVVIAVWAGIGFFLWKNWSRFDMSRVKDALRSEGRADGQAEAGNARPGEDRPGE